MFRDCDAAVRIFQSLRVLKSQSPARAARLLCMILAVLAPLLIDGITTRAEAQSVKALRGECAKIYKSWKKNVGYGAFAASKNGACGGSYGYGTAKEAQRTALAQCRKAGGKSCKILDQRSRPKLPPQRPNLKGESAAISLAAFQKKFGLSTAQMKARFGAAGRVVCPFGAGTVFLAERNDVFVTSDHIFLDVDKMGESKGKLSKCWVEFFFSKGRYAIKPSSVVHGWKSNKTAYQFYWFDWAVGQLDRPVKGVEPLATSLVMPGKNFTVSVVSEGMNDFTPRVCTGLVTSAWGNSSINDITTDCSTGPGSSGGPVIIGSLEKDVKLPLQVIGFTRGVRSNARRDNHQALPMSDAGLQRALRTLLGEPDKVQTVVRPFEIELLKLNEMGNYCILKYQISNRSKIDIAEMTFSLEYVDKFNRADSSQVSRVEKLRNGQTVAFEQPASLNCRQIREVVLKAVRSVIPAPATVPGDGLLGMFTISSSTKGVRLTRVNGVRN